MMCSRLPLNTVLAARRGRVGNDFFLEGIGHVHGVHGRSPGNGLVVADNDKGNAGKAAANDVYVAGFEMDGIEGGRSRESEVRIIGQKRDAAGGEFSADRPFI